MEFLRAGSILLTLEKNQITLEIGYLGHQNSQRGILHLLTAGSHDGEKAGNINISI